MMNKGSGLFLVFELTVVCLPYSCHITESYTKPSQKYPTTCMFLFRCYSRLSSNFLEKAHNKPVLDKSAFGLVLNSMPYLRNVKSIGFAYNFSSHEPLILSPLLYVSKVVTWISVLTLHSCGI